MRIKMSTIAKTRNLVSAAHGTVAGRSPHVPVTLVACSPRQTRRTGLRHTQRSQLGRPSGGEPLQTATRGCSRAGCRWVGGQREPFRRALGGDLGLAFGCGPRVFWASAARECGPLSVANPRGAPLGIAPNQPQIGRNSPEQTRRASNRGRGRLLQAMI